MIGVFPNRISFPLKLISHESISDLSNCRDINIGPMNNTLSPYSSVRT